MEEKRPVEQEPNKWDEYLEKRYNAQELSAQLVEHYENFTERIQKKEEGDRTFLKTLRSLFSDKRDTDQEVATFHDTVGNHITKLYDALKEETPEDASALSIGLVRMMLSGNEKREDQVAALAKISNQGFAIPLLSFLTKEQLTEVREEYLRENPKRLMFPNQRDVLKEMDRLLAE